MFTLLFQEDLLIHGDSVYDIIDKQDHAAIQAELMRGLQQNSHDHVKQTHIPPATLFLQFIISHSRVCLISMIFHMREGFSFVESMFQGMQEDK